MSARYQFYADGLTTRPIMSRRYGVIDSTYPNDEHGRPTSNNPGNNGGDTTFNTSTVIARGGEGGKYTNSA